MAPSPTCLSCNRPFPRNGELASLPEGRRIAFDPGQRRVWPICTKCGEWNLLGAEAAGAALGELEARVGQLPADVLGEVGPVEVIRIDASAPPPGAVRARGDRHARIDSRNTLTAFAFLGLLLLGLAWIGFSALDPIVPGESSRWGRTGTLVLAAMASGIFGHIPRALRRGEPIRSRLVIGLAVIAATIAIAHWLGDNVPSTGALIATLTFSGLAVQRWMPIGRITLPSGKRRWHNALSMDSTSCSWEAGGELTVRMPEGELLNGDDATAMLRDLLDGWSWETAPDELQAAAVLASGHDPLPRIIGVLRDASASRSEGTTLGRMPAVWRAALDLALTQDTGVEGKLSRILAKVPEAQQVAAIAESLDAERA